MPRVTVIMATHNWATVLPYSIGSVLDQTYADFELLVIGDGCMDESGDVVAEIQDPRVHWHNLPSGTKCQTGPNNEGLRRANGDVIAYLGHDDLWLPHHLGVLLGALDDGAALAYGTALVVPPAGRPILWPELITPSLAGDARVFSAEEMSDWIAPTTMMHDRKLARAVGGWRMPRDTGMRAPEIDLWIRMAKVATPPRWVRRVTSIKLPAALRRGVYRDRPHHEQAYWLRRIRESADPERVMTAACNEEYVYANGGVDAASVFDLRRTIAGLDGTAPRARLTMDECIRTVRRFKGIDDGDPQPD